jgi:hypothetical protein
VAADFFETCVDVLKLVVGDFVLYYCGQPSTLFLNTNNDKVDESISVSLS